MGAVNMTAGLRRRAEASVVLHYIALHCILRRSGPVIIVRADLLLYEDTLDAEYSIRYRWGVFEQGAR